MNATFVVGQTSVDSQVKAGVTASNLSGPNAVAFDTAGDMWVLDADSERALEYRVPISTGEPASVVVGQPNMTSTGGTLSRGGLLGPAAIAVSPSGDLWISDFAGDRVLEYLPPFADGMNASLVIGQSNFNTSIAATNRSSLDGPNRITFDSHGDLWVADTWNDRVLEFTPPFSTGMNASLVIGQPSFSSRSSGLNRSALADPRSVASSTSMLWVADSDNNRILGFAAPFSTGENATVVLGQPNFTASGGSGPNATSDVVSLFIDGSGDLWAADYTYNRVLEFAPPFSDFEAPALVIGQSSFSGISPGTGAANLSEPTGVAISSPGTLWVSDSGNNRVLGYPSSAPPPPPPTRYPVLFSETGVPGGTSWSLVFNGSNHVSISSQFSMDVLNGTYSWSLETPSGYRTVGPASGSVTVRGSSQTVDLEFAAVFSVTFVESGLPAGANWSVTFNGTTLTSSSATIQFVAENGSYAYLVAASESGYSATPVHGMFTVSPRNTVLAVQFSPSVSAPASHVWLEVLAAVAVAIVALALILVARRRKGPEAAPVAPAPEPPPPWLEIPPPTAPPPPPRPPG